MSKNYYIILGISNNATPEEIKQAYRKQAHLCHPDTPQGSEEKFKTLNEAYQVLGNPTKRSVYDAEGSIKGNGFAGTGMSWETFKKETQPQRTSTEPTQYDDLAIEKIVDEGIALVDDVLQTFLK